MRPFQPIRVPIDAFIVWWLGELRGIVPQCVRRFGVLRRPLFYLTWHGDEFAVLEIGARGEHEVARARIDDSAGKRRLHTVLRARYGGKRQLTLRLSSGQGLRRVLDLPIAAKDDVEQMLRLEMDRLTPFAAEEVYFAYRIIYCDPEHRHLRVELQLAPRSLVDKALAALATIGLHATRLELPSRGKDPQPTLNLLPGDASAGPRYGLRHAVAAVLLLSVIAATTVTLHQQHSTAARLERQVAAAKLEAEEIISLRDRLDYLSAVARFVVDKRASTMTIAHLLLALTRVIPDHAYLTELRIQNGIIQLHGYAEKASELIGALEKSPLFVTPEFRSPVTRDVKTSLDQFHISVEATGVTMPGNEGISSIGPNTCLLLAQFCRRTIGLSKALAPARITTAAKPNVSLSRAFTESNVQGNPI